MSNFKVFMFTAISRKVVGKNVHTSIPKGNMGYEQYTAPDAVAVESTFVAFLYHLQKYVHDLSCPSFKFLWRTVNSKPPTIPFRIVACTFSDNLSRNSCMHKISACVWFVQMYASHVTSVSSTEIQTGMGHLCENLNLYNTTVFLPGCGHAGFLVPNRHETVY